jgi:hypothetical protein
MGAPAVITVTDHTGQRRRFYGHWASPQWQIPHLAELIHQADTDRAPLRLATYLAYTAAHPNTLPGEDITGQPWHADATRADGLDYRYTLTLAETDQGLRYTVAERDQPYDRERMRPVEDLTGRVEVYAAAARMCQQMAATTRQLVERNGGRPLPGPSAQAWQAEAARYGAWAQQHAGREADEGAGTDPVSAPEPLPRS